MSNFEKQFEIFYGVVQRYSFYRLSAFPSSIVFAFLIPIKIQSSFFQTPDQMQDFAPYRNKIIFLYKRISHNQVCFLDFCADQMSQKTEHGRIQMNDNMCRY